MSDTDEELKTLCKQIYLKTGWNDMKAESKYTDDRKFAYSLYTSDYLLEKLQAPETQVTFDFGNDAVLCLRYNEDQIYWRAVSDTPLKALLKLTIALAESGELPKEES